MFRCNCRIVALTLAALIVIGALGCSGVGQRAGRPPETEKRPVVDTLHGVIIEDPYRWLEDQDSPETRVWIEAQNKYMASFYNKFPNMDELRRRLARFLDTDEVSLPIVQNGKYFYRKRLAGQQQYVIYMREGPDGQERALVDPHGLSDDFTTSADVFDVSIDGKIMAYSIRQGGEDEVAIHFLEVESGKELADSLARGLYFALGINADNSGFYYVLTDSAGGRIYFHKFGTEFASDPLLFGEQYGPSVYLSFDISENRRHLIIGVYHGAGGNRSELYLMDARNKNVVKPVVQGLEAKFYGAIGGDQIFIMTNHEAPNWCMYSARVADPAFEKWKLTIPEDQNATIETFGIAGGRIFVNYLESVSSAVKIFQPDGTYLGPVKLPALGSVSTIIGEWRGNEAFYTFSSFHQPKNVYRLDLSTGQSSVWQELTVPSLESEIEVNQVWYPSKDGTEIPMFVVHRQGIELDGTNQTYLTGYGGFNISEAPHFRPIYGCWLESGGVLAIPSLRGGGEFGEEWHRAGMLESKQNTFDDFIAAAEWLIANKYTSPEKLAIRGGSNGGLLVGATMNQRPDLAKAVICTYPLLDMVRYHKFLMAPYWISEYGSADSAAHFDFIYKYSPYHNVLEGGDYPAVLLVTGDGDTRVDPMHARKMTALLQDQTGSENPVLLSYDIKAGHSHGEPVSKQVEENAIQLGFLFWQLGVKL